MELKKGFTLIEILITIIIIGILSVIGISTYQSAQKKGRDFNRKAGLTAVMKALESYMNDKGVYPPSSPDGKILWCGTAEAPTVCPWGSSFSDIEATPAEGEEPTTYMASLPKDQVANQTYFYEAVPISEGGPITGYRLYAKLENTQDPDVSQYSTNCSADADIQKYCNYVLTSETVAAPTPYVTVTSTPTSSPTSTPTNTPSPAPCIADGGSCATGTCCTVGTCNTYYRIGGCKSQQICGVSAPAGYQATSSAPNCCVKSDGSFVGTGKVLDVNDNEYTAGPSHYCGWNLSSSVNGCQATRRWLGCDAALSCTAVGATTTEYANAGYIYSNLFGNQVAASSRYHCGLYWTYQNSNCSATQYFQGCVGGSNTCQTGNTTNESLSALHSPVGYTYTGDQSGTTTGPGAICFQQATYENYLECKGGSGGAPMCSCKTRSCTEDMTCNGLGSCSRQISFCCQGQRCCE